MQVMPLRVLCRLVTLASAVGHAQYTTSFESVRGSYTKCDFEAAMAGFRALSEQGDARAQVLLGLALKEGHHVPRVRGPGTLAKETTTVTYALHIEVSGSRWSRCIPVC